MPAPTAVRAAAVSLALEARATCTVARITDVFGNVRVHGADIWAAKIDDATVSPELLARELLRGQRPTFAGHEHYAPARRCRHH